MKTGKTLLTISMLAIVLNACKQAGNPANSVKPAMIAQLDTNQYTSIIWKDTLINFGKITEGDTVKLVYTFTNTGNKWLYINSVKPSCGCTIASFTETPVEPGDSGRVEAFFASRFHPGQQNKIIMVRANTKIKTNHKLIFSGEVIPKSEK
ncbi:MAG: hypothetical protein RLZZ28_2324 [Bacteroidota bacterium]